jgi:hypothetical protein
LIILGNEEMSKRKEVIKKLLDSGVGTKSALNSASTDTIVNLLETETYEVAPYHTIYEMLLRGEKTKEPTKLYNWMKLNSVQFPMPDVTYDQFAANPGGAERSPKPWGEVEYFLMELQTRLGPDWAKKVLTIKKNPKTGEDEPVHDLSKIKGVKRLGVPGRQGTVVKLTFNGVDYAIKVAAAGTSCGDGATGGMGFLKQARLQQISAEWGVTCPVYAVHCLPGKKEAPFMAMPMMGKRMIDIYPGKEDWSNEHQKQFWNLRLVMDTYVGMAHNDGNCLNVMTDAHNNVKLIDFDRSYLIDPPHIEKFGLYNNLCVLPSHGCFKIANNGKVLRKAEEKLYPTWKQRHPRYTGIRFYTGECTHPDPKGAVFFQPFKLVEPAVAVFPPQASSTNALRAFCKGQKYSQWEKLSLAVVENLIEAAEYCISKKKGNQGLANKIVEYVGNTPRGKLYSPPCTENTQHIPSDNTIPEVRDFHWSVIEAGDVPCYGGPRTVVRVGGLIGCVGVAVERYDDELKVVDVVAGHFILTGSSSTTMAHDDGAITKKGEAFLGMIKALMEKHDMRFDKHTSLNLYYAPKIDPETGERHGPPHLDTSKAMVSISNYLDTKGITIPGGSTIYIPVYPPEEHPKEQTEQEKFESLGVWEWAVEAVDNTDSEKGALQWKSDFGSLIQRVQYKLAVKYIYSVKK